MNIGIGIFHDENQIYCDNKEMIKLFFYNFKYTFILTPFIIIYLLFFGLFLLFELFTKGAYFLNKNSIFLFNLFHYLDSDSVIIKILFIPLWFLSLFITALIWGLTMPLLAVAIVLVLLPYPIVKTVTAIYRKIVNRNKGT